MSGTTQADKGLRPYVSTMEALESILSCLNYKSCLLKVECNTSLLLFLKQAIVYLCVTCPTMYALCTYFYHRFNLF